MKKRILALLLTVLLTLGLCACGQQLPETAADGAPWQEEWFLVGELIGVEVPARYTLLEYSDTLSVQGMYYAAWTVGEGTPLTDASGNELRVYDEQAVVLTATGEDEAAAGDFLTEWRQMADERYTIESTRTLEFAGQSYTVIVYQPPEGNSYDFGAAAWGVRGNTAINAEYVCKEGVDTDPLQALSELLENFHFTA